MIVIDKVGYQRAFYQELYKLNARERQSRRKAGTQSYGSTAGSTVKDRQAAECVSIILAISNNLDFTLFISGPGAKNQALFYFDLKMPVYR